MWRTYRTGIIILVLAVSIILVWGTVFAAPAWVSSPGNVQAGKQVTPTPLPLQPSAESPSISFIDSPTASCVVPRTNTGVCQLTWQYISVNADPNYIITATVGIDSQARARYSGFFQTSMTVPSELLVFRVPCGEAGSGGNPIWGAQHSYVLRARDSSGLSAANYGTVYCPADTLFHTLIPLLSR